MISATNTATQSLTAQFARRNTAVADWKAHLATQGAAGQSINAMEISWLTIKGGTGTSMTELWGTYLATKGFSTGNLKDRIKSFLTTGTQA